MEMIKVIIIDEDKSTIECSFNKPQFKSMLSREEFKPTKNKTIKDLHETIRKFMKGNKNEFRKKTKKEN